MHNLENVSIPIIGCLMEDVTFSLDRIQQATVARWTVKTAMVQDAIFTRPRELFFSTSERLGIRYDRGIPDFTRIWLGRSSLRTLTADGTDFVLDIHTGNEILETANGTVHTFCVGHLAIQIATIHAHEKYKGQAFDLTPHISAPWDSLLIPIWPITSDKVTWPPAMTFFGGRGLTKLADRFRGGTKREVWA